MSETTTTEAVRFTLEMSSGYREWCSLCGGFVDKLEEAASAAGVGLVCLDCVVAGEAAMRAKDAESLARHRTELAWLRAQQTLDATAFPAQIARAREEAAELEAHIAADEAALAAPWDVPSREAVAAYLAEGVRYWLSRDADESSAGDAAAGVKDAAASIRDLTGITVTF